MANGNLVDAVVQHNYKMSAIDSVSNTLNAEMEIEIETETDMKMIWKLKLKRKCFPK